MTAPKSTATDKPGRPLTLRDYETVIDQAESSFIAKGDAFKAIRDADLFKKSRDTAAKAGFTDYVTARWDYSPSYISRLISGAAVARLAQTLGYNVNEGQARELHGLLEDPEALEDILIKATDQGSLRLTAAAIRKVRMALAPVGVEDPEADALSDVEPDADPSADENWPGVIAESKKAFGRLVRDVPPEFCAMLADVFDSSRKSANSKARRAGKLKDAA